MSPNLDIFDRPRPEPEPQFTEEELDFIAGVLWEYADDLNERIRNGWYEDDDPPNGLASENLERARALITKLAKR